jgi:hypothetical protein
MKYMVGSWMEWELALDAPTGRDPVADELPAKSTLPSAVGWKTTVLAQLCGL